MLLPSREQIAAALKSVQLFAGLNDRQIAKLSHQAIARRAPAGEQIFVEGDECQGLYVIFSGAVKIFKQSTQGREQVLAVERAGAVVAELPVFDGGPYPASCISVEESVLLFISKQDFRRSCQEDPELALKVLSSVGARLRRLVTIIEELSFLTVRSRLAADGFHAYQSGFHRESRRRISGPECRRCPDGARCLADPHPTENYC